MNPPERVRDHLRRWMETTGVGQRAFAKSLGKTQVWLQKVLQGENHVRLRDLDQIAEGMRTTAADLIRTETDRQLIEVTPSELRLIERIRHRPDYLDAVLVLTGVRAQPEASDRVPSLVSPAKPILPSGRKAKR